MPRAPQRELPEAPLPDVGRDLDALPSMRGRNIINGLQDWSTSRAEHGNSAPQAAQGGPSRTASGDGKRQPGDPVTDRNGVFLSYSHKDEKFLKQLVDHLKPLERQGRVSSWSDLQIRAGSQWFDEIQKALSRQGPQGSGGGERRG